MTLTLDFALRFAEKQSVSLLLNSERKQLLYFLETLRGDLVRQLILKIPASAVTGDHFVRVRVDGAESALDAVILTHWVSPVRS